VWGGLPESLARMPTARISRNKRKILEEPFGSLTSLGRH
jgi:hypothetical protein